MLKVVLLGQGMVATHFAIGLERIKRGELKPYGVPLANHDLPYKIKDIEIVASYDVDDNKVGKTLYTIAKSSVDELPIPETLKEIPVRRGIHLRSLEGLGYHASGLEDEMELSKAIERLLDEWHSLDVDVVVNIITTEHCQPFEKVNVVEKIIRCNKLDRISASQAYAYVAALYSKIHKPIAFINAIPSPLANDPAFIELYRNWGGVILGDDGATGATPLTADLLEHFKERNRKVLFIVQFNIGGNTDFLALTIPEKNLMKEHTKSSIVKDILGYDAPHYIKPTGYVETLGDKKFVSIHMEYLTWNGLKDEFYVNARINDSPALAGSLADLVRLGKIAVDKGLHGTIPEINAFYMKKPGPRGTKSIAKIVAYQRMIKWLNKTLKS